MLSLIDRLTAIASDAFSRAGLDPAFGTIVVSQRPELGDFQCNGSLSAAASDNRSPREIADTVSGYLSESSLVAACSVAGPGFINISLSDAMCAAMLEDASADGMTLPPPESVESIVLDYGGANIAKPLHVGHLRAAIIGESIKRIARANGHRVIGDVHLGDWGLQMGMVISEIRRRSPDLPYFDTEATEPYPAQSPVTANDLEDIYPAAALRCKSNPEDMNEARTITAELQTGHAGYRALWRHIHDTSVADLKDDYARLNIEFDLWLGESDSAARIPGLIDELSGKGYAERSQGALVIFVNEPGDRRKLPPVLLEKSDGAALYGTTDIATIHQRVEEFSPDRILYVVDKRQSDHFVQVFRAVRKTGIAPSEAVSLEHLGFGTMNGKDRKPFKTREGGVMKLKDLIAMLVSKARERMTEVQIGRDYDPDETEAIARMVGVAALKFGDLANQPSTDYVFDLDRFAAFEGKTGPYLLYAAVRIKSILRNAGTRVKSNERILPAMDDSVRQLQIKLLMYPDQMRTAWEKRAPHFLCDYAHELASLYSAFYREHHILTESDPARKASWLRLSETTLEVLDRVCDSLGIEIPDRM